MAAKEDQTLSLEKVDYKGHYYLCKASLGQLIVAFSEIPQKRMFTKEDKNEYEKIMATWFGENIETMIAKYMELLEFENENTKEREVILHNLLWNLPKGITINQEEHNIHMSSASVGKMIAALKQRLDFILTRDPPKMYENDGDYMEAFNKMKTRIQSFYEYLLTFEMAFAKAVLDAKKNNVKN